MLRRTKRLMFEGLESKRLLAIVWANEAAALDTFIDEYEVNNATSAHALVRRAIEDWNAVIDSFNYSEDMDTDPNNDLDDEFQLSIVAQDLGGSTRGVVQFADSQFNVNGSPFAGTVRMDDDGGGDGWFFDTTPDDDAEFSGIAGSFSASFIDAEAVAQNRRDDFYRTLVHEIGHALGISSNPNAAIASMLTPLVDEHGDPVRYLGLTGQPQLARFESTFTDPEYGVTATFNGGHIYEGSAGYLLEDPAYAGILPDPATVMKQGSDTPIDFQTHPHDLMNPGDSVPAGIFNPGNETVRQWISDLNVQILADAYGYSVTLPSTLDTAHATLDSLGGALLVQGSPRDVAGAGLNDTITLSLVGDNVQVQVDTPTLNTTELFPLALVQQIVIAGHGGTDTVTYDPSLAEIVSLADYVVSSNEDEIEDEDSLGGGTLGDGLVDLQVAVPGSQTTLRGAVRDANSATVGKKIFLPRSSNAYGLTRHETESNNAANNDLDITGDVTIIGAGPGLSVIDAMPLGGGADDRHFHVLSGGSLELSRVTLTGGEITGGGGGGAIRVDSGGTLTLDQAALVDNEAGGNGGAILNRGDTIITRSVFTHNSTSSMASAVFSDQSSTLGIGASVFAANAVAAYPNTRVTGTASGVTLGRNLVDGNAGAFFDEQYGDVILDSSGGTSYVVTSIADEVDASNNAFARSLREAVQAANDATGEAFVWLPAWRHQLVLTGTEQSDASVNDLDIEGDVTIAGVGPGMSVIEAALDGDMVDGRVFQVEQGAELSLSGATVTGGYAGSGANGGGGAFRVEAGGALTLDQTAIVDNLSMGNGGAIYNEGDTLITRSVFTSNTTQGTASGVFSDANSTLGIGSSVFALNTVVTHPNVRVNQASNSEGATFGNNLVDSNAGGFFDASYGDTILTGTQNNFVVTSAFDVLNATDDATALSLREAIRAANDAGAHATVWLPGWYQQLSLVGTEASDAAANDLDITGEIAVHGVGAGISVIDATGIGGATQGRAFEVQSGGDLALSGLTLTGGDVTAGTGGGGGAVRVVQGGEVDLTRVALIANSSAGDGGAVLNLGATTVAASVFEGNSTGGNGGAIFSTGGTLTVGGSVFANNASGATPDSPNVRFNMGSGSATTDGGNLADQDVSSPYDFFDTMNGDYIGSVDFVVTSVEDSMFEGDDAYSLSLREAVATANDSAGMDEVWLPDWDYVLTRNRESYSTAIDGTDIDAAYGDLDVSDSLTLRAGAGTSVTVKWRPLFSSKGELADAVFDLLGDYNGDGIANGTDNGEVGAEDYTIWRDTLDSTTDLRADGDDDGIVDNDDFYIWQDNFGNVLDLIGVAEA